MAQNPSIRIKIEACSRSYVVDAMTPVLRATGWRPWKEHVCGCTPEALCADHAAIRLAEHYNPKERPRCPQDPTHFADSHDPGGAWFGVSHEDADRNAGAEPKEETGWSDRVIEAIRELRILTTCSCGDVRREIGQHHADCLAEYRAEVEILATALDGEES